MLTHLKTAWRELKRGKPGRRFRERYERARGGAAGPLRKWALVGGGALMVLLGIALLPLPGPGLPVIAGGVLLMAEESHATARTLDWLEIKARRWVGRPLSRR